MGRLHKLNFLNRTPLTVIEFFIGCSTLVGGIYLLSPFFALNVLPPNAPVLIQILASPFGLFILGVAMTLSAMMMIAGIYARNYHLRSAGLFGQLVIRIYTVVAVIIGQGFLPLVWLGSFTIICISVVLWLHIRMMIKLMGRNDQ